jgi:phage protein D
MPSVSYILAIDDAPAPSELLAAIQQIEVEDHADMADMMRIRISVGGNDSCSGWNVLDEDLFRRLTKLKLSVAVGSGLAETLMIAYVTELNADLSNQPGRSVLNITAMDPTVLMTLDETVKPWPDMADSDIATTIFSDRKYGFTPVVDETGYTRRSEEETVMQRGTDIQLLQQLAGRNGFECFVETEPRTGLVQGHFHKPRLTDPQGVLSVHMGDQSNVNSLNFREDNTRPATAAVTGIDIRSGENQPVNVESNALTQLGNRAALPQEQPRRVLPAMTGLSRSGELHALAQSVVDRTSFSITGEGDLNTVAYGDILRAKRPVMVRGAGRKFSGTYYVERVMHSITPEGYQQRFSLRRNATGLTGQESFVASLALPS